MNLPVEVIEAVKAGRCVLFWGSRASLESAELADAVYPDAKALATALGWKKPKPVPGAKPKPVVPSVEEGALGFEQQKGREKLVSELRQQIGAAFAPSPAYKSAIKHFPLIYTTAVDDLMERSGHFTVVTRSEPLPSSVDSSHPTLVKLRGSLDRPDTLLLTRADFDSRPLGVEQRKQLRSLIRNHVILFVGYRPDEEEFERLFAELSDAYGGELPRCHLAVAQGAIDDYLWQKWVWRGLLMFMADPTEAMAELEATV
jgi:hypothetical protein